MALSTHWSTRMQRANYMRLANAAQNILDRRANAKIPGDSGAVKFVQDAITTPGGLNYQGIKHLRSALGEMTSDQMVSQGITNQERDQIYGALTEDLKGTILDHGGPDALNAFEKANNVAKQVFSRRSDLAKIVGIRGDTAPELVFDKISQMMSQGRGANLNRLMVARRAIGHDAWDEVASALIARAGRDANGNFSPDRFVTWLWRLEFECASDRLRIDLAGPRTACGRAANARARPDDGAISRARRQSADIA